MEVCKAVPCDSNGGVGLRAAESSMDRAMLLPECRRFPALAPATPFSVVFRRPGLPARDARKEPQMSFEHSVGALDSGRHCVRCSATMGWGGPSLPNGFSSRGTCLIE